MKKRLVIGYGNDGRNDDGTGWFVVSELSKLNLPGVTLETAHQLEVDLAEVVRDFDEVIFVDAAIPESPEAWRVEEVDPGICSHGMAHSMAPGDVLGLCRALCGQSPRGRLFSIRGHDFGFGNDLSPETRRSALEVVREIAVLEPVDE